MKRKLLKNIAWLFFDRIFRLTMSLIIGVWLVRYLGPSQFGQLNYSLAYVGLFGALTSLGFNEIVVRDLVKEAGNEGTTLGSAFFLQFLVAIIGLMLLLLIPTWFSPVIEDVKPLIYILGITLLFKPVDILKYWFESHVDSSSVVWVENAVFFIFSGIKIVLILLKCNLMFFAYVITLEALFTAIFLILAYRFKGNKFSSWAVTSKKIWDLLNDSWPLALSSVAVLIYMRIDQVIIGNKLGDSAVGIFSAATRLCEVWYFIPMAISASIFPALLGIKLNSQPKYDLYLQKLFDLMAIISFFVAIIVSIFSEKIIELIYGPQFTESANVLSVMIWSGIFVSFGVARGKWIIAEELQHLGWLYAVAALVVNIICNYWLIDEMGVVGSAWASLFAQFTSVVLAPALHYKTRPSVFMMLKALSPFEFFKNFKEVFSYLKIN